MVWGCMSGREVGQLYRWEGTMCQDQFISPLKSHASPASALYGEGQAFCFKQDNAPCHKARRGCDFMEHSDVEVSDWPAQSPDLNPCRKSFSERHRIKSQVG